MKTKSEIQESIEALKEAQAQLFEAIEMIETALRGTSVESLSRAYLIPALEMAAVKENSWIGSNSANIDSLIERLEEDIDDEDYDKLTR